MELIHGDSGPEMAGVVKRPPGPALFWLDGHYSGGDTARGIHDTPINEELRAIFQPGQPDHIVLIDDARCFGDSPTYPTLEEVKQLVQSLRPAGASRSRATASASSRFNLNSSWLFGVMRT